MSDQVNSPEHYRAGGIECIDVIEAWRLGFRLANVVKYVLRAGRKGPVLEDLRKAEWYLAREIRAIASPGGIPAREDAAREERDITPVRKAMAARIRELEAVIREALENCPTCRGSGRFTVGAVYCARCVPLRTVLQWQEAERG